MTGTAPIAGQPPRVARAMLPWEPRADAYPHRAEFSVITVGTGAPELSVERACACTVVQCGGHYYVVDTGAGAALGFVKGGPKGPYRVGDIAAVLFSHLHQDHVNDYFDLATARWADGGKRLDLVGPPGVAELHRSLVTFFRDDLTYRWLNGMTRGVDQQGMFAAVDIRELIGADRFALGPLQVTTDEMTHTMYDLAYRFDFGDRSIVVSGDTSFDPRLIALAAGADVIVVDANPWADGSRPAPHSRPLADLPPESASRPPHSGVPGVANHMPIQDVARVAAESAVGKVVLTHLWPLDVDAELERRTAALFSAAGFDGEVIFAVDGLEIDA